MLLSCHFKSFMNTIVEGSKLIFCGKRGLDAMSKNKPLFPLMLFLILRSLIPSTTTNVYAFLSYNVSVLPWQYNTLNISTSVASLIASFLYHRFLVGKKLLIIVIATTIAACLTGILQIYMVSGLFNGTTLFWVCIVIMDINSIASQMAFIPLLILVSKACPTGYEASMWAIFFSLNDLAGSIGGKFVEEARKG